MRPRLLCSGTTWLFFPHFFQFLINGYVRMNQNMYALMKKICMVSSNLGAIVFFYAREVTRSMVLCIWLWNQSVILISDIFDILPRDKDQDTAPSYNCAQGYRGAWWFAACINSFLTATSVGAFQKAQYTPYLVFGGTTTGWYTYKEAKMTMKLK